MQTYRVDFFDDDGNIYSRIDLREADDATAIEHAHRINIPSSGGRFEIWQGTRLVLTHRNS